MRFLCPTCHGRSDENGKNFVVVLGIKGDNPDCQLPCQTCKGGWIDVPVESIQVSFDVNTIEMTGVRFAKVP